MKTDDAWRDLYRTALLELQPDELWRRICVAEKAILLRIAELKRDASVFDEERLALDDALRGLRILASTECIPVSAGFGFASRQGQS
jgi:hypothetical protein